MKIDENVNPNIMLSTVMLNNQENVTSRERTTKTETVFKEQVFKKRRHENNKNGKERPPLTEKKVVTFHTPSVPSFYEYDIKMIEIALGGTERTHVEKFEKEHKQTLQAIMQATLQELSAIRQLEKNSIGFGGLKKAGIKKWKFLVKLDDSGKISQLVIGKFKASGSFTKVYLALDGKAILVPRKSQSKANMQMHQAYSIIAFLHCQYPKNPQHLQQVIPLLPPLPEKFMIGRRPIMVAPQATCAGFKFHNPPSNMQDVIVRLEIIRDAAKGLAFCHEKGLIHGDIKPDNILINQSGKGQLHDFGGSCVFSGKEKPADAALKYKEISLTAFYTHYQDYLARSRLNSEGANVDSFVHLGCARDVFSLGVSTIDTLMGLYGNNRNKLYPFHAASYYACDKIKASFPNGDFNSCRELTCVQQMPPEIGETLKTLLKASLDKDYVNRITASEFGMQLDKIIIELKAVTS